MAGTSNETFRPIYPQAGPPDSQAIKKKLVICSDGTWNDSDSPERPLTNVARIARCISEIHSDGSPQIVFYQSGVGTGRSKFGNVIEGATGIGISENIRDAYSFICHNFSDGDEIFLIGFSRGAFTVRSIASLIEVVGILNKRGLGHFHQVYDLWKRQLEASTDRRREAPMVKLTSLCECLEEQKFLIRDILIRVCAVWDTVGAFGVPLIWFLPQHATKKLAFVNSRVCGNIEFAIQALALNERRRHFQPTIWRPPENSGGKLKELKQCWFLGCHSDVGGGVVNTSLSNITLVWMIAQLKRFLTFDDEALFAITAEGQQRETSGWIADVRVPMLLGEYGFNVTRLEFADSDAMVTQSMRGIFKLGGSKKRRPGQHFGTDRGVYRSGHSKFGDQSADNYAVSECIHFTVRALVGKGFAPVTKSLKNAIPNLEEDKVSWSFPKSGKGKSTIRIAEDKASPDELEFLRLWLSGEPSISDDQLQHRAAKGALDEPTLPFGGQLLSLLKEATEPKITWSSAGALPTRPIHPRTEVTAYFRTKYLNARVTSKFTTRRGPRLQVEGSTHEVARDHPFHQPSGPVTDAEVIKKPLPGPGGGQLSLPWGSFSWTQIRSRLNKS